MLKGDPAPPPGLVVAYGADQRNGFCYLAAVRFEGTRGRWSLMEAPLLLVDYLFQGWPFRKLYMEVAEYNLVQFGSAVGELLVEEGRLVEHTFLDGRYWDAYVFALHRDNWMQRREQYLRLDQVGETLPDHNGQAVGLARTARILRS